MGKGDKKSKRGKIFAGSFGKRRPRKRNQITSAVVKTEEVKNEEAPKAEVELKKEKTKKTAAEEKKTKKGKSSKKGSKE